MTVRFHGIHRYVDVEIILKKSLTMLLLGLPKARGFLAQPKSCSSRLSAAEFFKDAPWLSVPKDRRGEILIEPLYPPGRLLGGSPSQGGKVSKLAALAAARKKKCQEKNQDSPLQNSTTSVTLLDKLSGKESTKRPLEEAPQPDFRLPVSGIESTAELPESRSQPYSTLKSSGMLFQGEKDTADSQSLPTLDTESFGLKPAMVARVASPSTFARVMFGLSNTVPEPPPKRMKMMFTLPQVPNSYAENNPFAGPSPDDIVRNAQESKGLASNLEN